MSIQTDFSRLVNKRSSSTGVVPTIPSTETIDETWIATDLKIGEIFINTADQKIWYRATNGIVEITGTNGLQPQTTTADATPVDALTIPIAESTCRFLEISVVAMQDDDSRGYYKTFKACYRNDAGTVNLVGTAITVEQDDFTTATSSLSISGTNVIVSVTGEAATDIVWAVKYQEAYVDTTI
jgi:hypothetical protein